MTDKDIKDYCKNCSVEPPAMRFKCPECEHNPDKEQIIIDGVDVSKCEFYMHYDYGKFSHGCSLHKDMFGLPVCCDIADCCKDCYFKQLARKTQECEQIKEKYEALKLENEEGYEIVDELKHEYEELENKIKKLRKNLALEIEASDRYRKALDEIEKYIKKYECDNCEDYVFGCGDCGTPRDILDILNKATDRKNEN